MSKNRFYAVSKNYFHNAGNLRERNDSTQSRLHLTADDVTRVVNFVTNYTMQSPYQDAIQATETLTSGSYQVVTPNKSFQLLRKEGVYPSLTDMPIMPVPGLDLTRQHYLFEKIRIYVDAKRQDEICPRPSKKPRF